MNCTKCGNLMKPDMKFCAKCGTPAAPQQPAQPQNNVQPKPPVSNQQPVQNQPQKPADAQPMKKAKKDKKGGKNIALKIIAIILVIAVLASGGLLLADNIMYKNEIKADEYITDFPVLKQKTDFLVYNAEKFPSSNYRIKVERLLNGGILKSEALRKAETIIDEKSTDAVYSIDFKEDGNYRIILEDISAIRTQPATSTTQQEATTKKTETAETIVIDVKVDNDDESAIDKVDINSKPGDKPIELPSENSKPSGSDFIEATDEDFEKLRGMLCNLKPFLMQFEYSSTDVDAYKTLLSELSHPFGDITFYYYMYGEYGERVYINEYNKNAKPDPLNKLGQCYEIYPADKLDWILINIFNVTPDRENATVVNEYGTELYYYDGNYYIAAGDGGDICTEHLEIVDKQIGENNVYTVKYSIVSSENVVLKTYKTECALKNIDGEKYWSIYKIEKYTPNAEQSSPQTDSKNDTTIPQNVKVGDYITFGKYEQDNNTSNGNEDIEWLVLEVQDDKAFVISKYVLECCCGNRCFGDGEARWDKSAVRAWLNNDFMNNAFTSDEKERVVNSTVKADDNPDYSCEQGSDTQDYVFLLSAYETEKYLDSAEKRESCLTEYCMENSHVMRDSRTGAAWWMMRTSAGGNCYVFMNDDEMVTAGRFDDMGIRPAMWITLK